MSVDCGACFAKYLLCLFNFVFFITGTVVLGVGVWLACDKTSFLQLTKILENNGVNELSQFTQPNVVDQLAYVLIATGAFIFFVSFLGYCGALRESRCLLACYGVALLIILVVEITVGVVAYVYKEEAETTTRDFLKKSIKDYYTTPDQADLTTVVFDRIMLELQCCGVDNYHDFKESAKWRKGNQTVPKACCVLMSTDKDLQPKDPSCPYSPSEANSYYMTGCYKTFINTVLAHANLAIGIGIGFGAIQLIGMFLAFCLCKSIDKYLK